MAGRAWREQSKSGDYTLQATDNMTFIVCSAALTISGTAATLGNGFICILYNTHSAAITIPGSGSLSAGNACILTTNGTVWRYFYTVNGTLPTVGAITSTAGISASASVSAGQTYTSQCYINADGTLSLVNFDTNDYLAYNRSTNIFAFVIGGTTETVIDSTAIYPASDTGQDCGKAVLRWGTVYANNGTIQTSDKRRKDDLGPLGEVGTIIDALQPVAFAWKADGAHDVGFYAQDVALLIPEAVFVGDDKVDWGFKPDRLIPFLVREIQSLRRRVADLESR
jgi:hypothetical protein